MSDSFSLFFFLVLCFGLAALDLLAVILVSRRVDKLKRRLQDATDVAHSAWYMARKLEIEACIPAYPAETGSDKSVDTNDVPSIKDLLTEDELRTVDYYTPEGTDGQSK